jgi:hydrogenase maturation protease
MTTTRIIGIGSPFGDDAVGLEVAAALTASPPPDCEIIAADRPGVDLIQLLAGCDSVILIDAICSGGKPGTLRELEWSEARFVSSHDLALPTAIQLARKLGHLPSSGKVLAIEIEAAPPPQLAPLSAPARQAVARAVEQVRAWVSESDLRGPGVAKNVHFIRA